LSRLAAIALAALLASCGRPVPRPAAPAYDWAVDPAVPGPDLPPAGQSLFDALTTDPLPFPFPKLLAGIVARIGAPVRYRRVLIPLGRSLQRSAGAPDFFRYPRAIAAFDDSSSPLIKDRLFLGYQEKAGVIEILSYNEQAARFEFQLVKDYRPGAVPRVYYAHRRVCTVCHQNQAPLFPRQLWDETNANYRVSGLLLEEKRDYYGFPVRQTADEPYAIDLAVHRANELSTYQLLWAEAGPDRRRDVLAAVLRCRASGACDPPDLAAWWRSRWPRGIAIPNPEIADRDPLAILSREGPADRPGILAFLARRQKNIEPLFEPATPRPPLEIWYGDPERVERVVRGLAAHLPAFAKDLPLTVPFRVPSRLPAPQRLPQVEP
jgi:hypothetical protein